MDKLEHGQFLHQSHAGNSKFWWWWRDSDVSHSFHKLCVLALLTSLPSNPPCLTTWLTLAWLVSVPRVKQRNILASWYHFQSSQQRRNMTWLTVCGKLKGITKKHKKHLDNEQAKWLLYWRNVSLNNLVSDLELLQDPGPGLLLSNMIYSLIPRFVSLKGLTHPRFNTLRLSGSANRTCNLVNQTLQLQARPVSVCTRMYVLMHMSKHILTLLLLGLNYTKLTPTGLPRKAYDSLCTHFPISCSVVRWIFQDVTFWWVCSSKISPSCLFPQDLWQSAPKTKSRIQQH